MAETISVVAQPKAGYVLDNNTSTSEEFSYTGGTINGPGGKWNTALNVALGLDTYYSGGYSISDLATITNLDISDTSLTSAVPYIFSYLSSISTLKIKTSSPDYSNIKYLHTVELFDIAGNTNLTSIDFLTHFYILKTFYDGFTKVLDFTPIAYAVINNDLYGGSNIQNFTWDTSIKVNTLVDAPKFINYDGTVIRWTPDPGTDTSFVQDSSGKFKWTTTGQKKIKVNGKMGNNFIYNCTVTVNVVA